MGLTCVSANDSSLPRLLLLCAMLALLAAAMPVVTSAQSVTQFQGKRIARVEIGFEGLKETADQGEFFDIINILPGEEYSVGKIREAILKLYKSGRAANVKVQANNSANGVILQFLVTRQLRVDKVTFSGQLIFPEMDLQPRVVGLDPGAKVSQPNIDRSAENLVEFYQETGYFQVRVDTSVKPDPVSGRAVVNFIIMPGEQAKVARFDIIGDNKVDISGLKTLTGGVFTRLQLQSDIELLRKRHIIAGYLDPRISAPMVSYDSENNTVNLSLTVYSGPQVEVLVEGIEVKPERLRKTLPLLQQGGVDEFAIEEGRLRLLELVQREGFFFADITTHTEQPDKDSLKIIYTVDRGRRYRVADIRMLGVDEFTYETIVDDMKSREASFLSRGITSQDYLVQDSQTIAAKLKDLGYTQATVQERRLGVSPNNENLIITFVVDKGLRIMVDEVRFRGRIRFSDEELRANLPERDIPYFSNSRLNEDIEALLTFYSKEGFAEAEVETEVTKLDDQRVRIVFRVEEGDQVLINRIIVNNRGRSSERAIRKYLTFQEGDLLKREDFSKSEQQLYATGAFRIAVIHSEFISRNGDGRALHDVFVETIESQPYTLIYGFGYQSEDGPRGQFQISNANFLGRLQTATLTLRGSRREQLAQVSYQFPRPFGLPVNPLAVFFFQRREDVSFDSRRFAALLQLERRLSETSELIFRYTFEDVKVFNLITDSADLDRDQQPITLGRLSGAFIRDTRDSIFNATKGTFTTGDLSVASVALGSEREFIRFFASHQHYLRVLNEPRVIFASNTQMGLAHSFDDRVRLPISERFFAGGANTLRGFSFEKAGPRSLTTGQPLGGNALLILNSELRFPLSSQLGGVLFYDTGNVFRTISDIRVSNFSNTLGVGLRVSTPVGPVRIDVGYLVNPNTPERRVQFHFSFGQAF
ncbi:MAG: outer membrane protein assembly factor BamA [Acidobacteriota bacterium]